VPPDCYGPFVDTGCDQLLADVDGDGVATITFANPAKHNAMTGDMLAALARTSAALSADPAVRVVVVRGAGETAFVSGADLSQLGDSIHAPDPDRDPNRAGQGLADGDTPVIAMIHGWCLGGGVAVALSADVRLCADDAVFGIPAAKLGVGYPAEAIATLVALVGPGQAAEILLGGRRLDATEAARIGLVNRVVPKADLEAVTYDLAREIAGNAPLSHAAHRRAIRAAVTGDPTGVAEAIAAAWASEDFREGGRAMAEKRPPVFRGR